MGQAGEELDDGSNPRPGYRRTGHAVSDQIRCKAADARAVDASELAEAARQVEGANRQAPQEQQQTFSAFSDGVYGSGQHPLVPLSQGAPGTSAYTIAWSAIP